MKKFTDIVSKDKASGFEAAARKDIDNKEELDKLFETKLQSLTETKMKKQMRDINSAWEAEIKKTLDALWENRYRLSLANVELLRRFANKTKL